MPPPPPELPGFYYDPEKNRYFPIKGPIPGSSRSSFSSSSSSKHATHKAPQTSSTQEKSRSSCRNLRSRTSKLIQAREIDGFKCSFTEEFRNIQASQPSVWRYKGTHKIGISDLKQVHVRVQTLEGECDSDIILTGSTNGSFSLCEVGRDGGYFDGEVEWSPDFVKNYVKGKSDEHNVVPGTVSRPTGGSVVMSSGISCIRLGPECSSHVANGGPIVGHALFTTLGSETSGGSIYTLGLVESLDLGPGILNTWSRLDEVASFKCTIWTAEYDYNRHRAIIGTNMGAASVDLATGRRSWFLRCKSDIFAQQIVNSRNLVLCGLRNGAIVSVDFREKRDRVSRTLTEHRIPYASSNKKVRNSSKEWFKVSGDIDPSLTIRMPSSISSLVSLQYDDQYFLASSMDGTMRLYDLRQLQRGSVQSYDGHVNSHSRIQLGVDPSERFVMSGGEDHKLRSWSIKTGKLLFEEKFCDSVLSSVCYQSCKGFKAEDEMTNQYKHESCMGAWLGSHDEGLFYMRWLYV
ncbi:hypothetical protein PIB30_005259 [Stylosanthes scabra]|uniref:Uncharacterized protein n=1 Tax=Stylosanthes scabra TaxID=79078 RepID=A0ABU6T5V9_9FABA|nr:hypothetical protein [Stylosanthes scabra]